MLGPAKPRRLDQPIAVSLEGLVPANNFYRHLGARLDLGFVREWVTGCYAERGRPGIDPVVFFKLQLVMFFEGTRPESGCLVSITRSPDRHNVPTTASAVATIPSAPVSRSCLVGERLVASRGAFRVYARSSHSSKGIWSMSRRTPLPALLCSGLLTLTAAGCGENQSPTPTPPASPAAGLPATSDPAACTFAEATYDDFLARVDTLTGTPRAALPEATPTETGVASRQPRIQRPDAATRAAVVATIREAVACLNATNNLAFFALMTDQLLLENLARGGMPADQTAANAATPPPIPPEQNAALQAVRQVRMLPDGRIRAVVELIVPAEGPEVQVYSMVLRQLEGRWLIDLLINNQETQALPVSGTPAP